MVLRRVQGGYSDRLSLLEARQLAQELLHGQHIAGVHRVQRLLHGAQRALLLGQRHFALDGQGQVGQKAADAVVHARAAAVGRIDQDDGIVHIFPHAAGAGQQRMGKQIHAAAQPARLQRLRLAQGFSS